MLGYHESMTINNTRRLLLPERSKYCDERFALRITQT